MSGRNPFDDDDGGGFGGGRSSSNSRGSRESERGYGGGGGGGGYGYGGRDERYGYGGGGGGGYDNSRQEEDEHQQRLTMANRRMEESSANSLRTLNETMRMGIDTTTALEEQAETLDRTERTLDTMHVDLDQGKSHLRKIKSPFGGFGSWFSKKSTVQEVTDPAALRAQEKKRVASSSASKSSQGGKQKKQQQQQSESTGNTLVDSNLDEMSKALDQLQGIGELMSHQLDDSEVQLDRVKYKIDRNEVKVTRLNKDIKKQL